MTKTKVKLEFVLEHEGDRMLGTFNTLDFIEGGIRAVGLAGNVRKIEPGATQDQRLLRKRVKSTKKSRS